MSTTQVSFILVDDTQTGQQALDAARQGNVLYIVIRRIDGSFSLARVTDFRPKLTVSRWLSTPLRDLPVGAFTCLRVATIQQDSVSIAEQARSVDLKDGEFLLVLSGDQVTGLLAGTPTRRDYHEKSAEPTEPDAEPPVPVKERFINVGLTDADSRHHNPTAQPLQKGQVYSLIFYVDNKLQPDSFTGDTLQIVDELTPTGSFTVLTVHLESDDFTLYDEPEKKLLLPRTGKSKNRVVFLVEPKHDGACSIQVIFLKEGNFIQAMLLKFNVGATKGVLFEKGEPLGRGVNAALAVRPRDVSLTILNTGTGFHLVLIAPGGGATATIPLKLDELKDIATQARQELLEVVRYQKGGQSVYQESVEVAEDVRNETLKLLARAGYRLYQRIFFGPAADIQCQELGRRLGELARQEHLKIQIFSQDFVLPWGLLYCVERFDPQAVDPDCFLGLKHIIEHIPLQRSGRFPGEVIASQPSLSVSLNVNTDIDRQMEVPFVGQQLEYWDRLKQSGLALSLVTRRTKEQVTEALANPSTPDQVLYFYCHGISKDVDDKGGVDTSTLVLSGDGRLTLEDLNVDAPMQIPLANSPLVFINACESAKVSPLVYDGFVPYFIAKGARGVIGTECEVPAIFAVAWAKQFFDCFLHGEPVGEIFLKLRREFFAPPNHNILGLLYALYVDGDTHLEPGLV